MAAPKKCYFITAAIDFGTTFSGYAYGFKSDIEKEEPLIITNQWAGGRVISHKAPTSLLFNPDKTFNSFGYKAEEKYAELCSEEEHASYYFFHRFKMLLHSSEKFSKTMTIKEEAGKSMPALDVFAEGIRFMKQHLMESVLKRISSLNDDDIGWVLTVPAIWQDGAKVFMREAAEKAGITHDQLTIALEPESASVYCQRIPTERMVDSDGTKLKIAEAKSKFMVLDMGGGTADITVHEREGCGTLKELHRASGGAWGGTKVDHEFVEFLKSILHIEKATEDVFTSFKKACMEDYVDLLREFEMKKRDTKLESEAKVTIKLPVSLHEIFEEASGGKKIQEVIKEKKLGDKVRITADRMRLSHSLMTGFFKPAVDKLIAHVQELYTLPEVSDVDTILMVGGFSGSCLLQEAVRKNFPSKKLYVPGEPDLAVLLGAVLFGNDPGVITSRKSKFTYGVGTSEKFKVGEHDEKKKQVLDGEDFCRDVFSQLVKMDSVLKVGEPVCKIYYPAKKDNTKMHLKIFAAAEQSPKYVTDTCCKQLGSITIDMPDTEGGTNREVEVKVHFAGTELEVEALEKKTMKTYKTKINFLD